MDLTKLHDQIVSAKKYLNSEYVRMKNDSATNILDYKQVGDQIDLIHNIERVGVKNLNDREMRKITRLLSKLPDNIYIQS